MEDLDFEIKKLETEILNLEDQKALNKTLIENSERQLLVVERDNWDGEKFGEIARITSQINGYKQALRNNQLTIEQIKSRIEGLKQQKQDAEKSQKIDVAVSAAEKLDEYFKNQIGGLIVQRKFWFRVTYILAGITAAFALAIMVITLWFGPEAPNYNMLIAKFFIFSAMFSASVWSGNIYKTVLHQISFYEDKAVLTETFIKFKSAGFSSTVQDAVLIEATRTIFSGIKTGYLGKNDSAGVISVGDLIKAGK